MKKILLLSVLNINGTSGENDGTCTTCKKCPVNWGEKSKMLMLVCSGVVTLNQLTGLWINLCEIFGNKNCK